MDFFSSGSGIAPDTAQKYRILLLAGILLVPEALAQTATPESGVREENQVPPPRNMDWVPIEELSIKDRARVRPNCCGAYISPPRNYSDADLKPEKAPLRADADSTEAQGSKVIFEGDVQVSQGYRQLRSDRAEIDQAERSAKLEGNITYREPGVLVTGDEAYVNLDSQDMEATNVAFVLHESNIRGEASRLNRPEENRIHIDDVTYTTCEPSDNTWLLKASSIDINTAREQATARNVRLKVKDWPVAYIPWIRFPISSNRATGLLFPSVLTGNNNGLDYAQPVYLNLAPNYDATLTPRILQERGAMAEAEFRHLSAVTETTFAGGYLADDDGGSQNEKSHQGENRWTLGINHLGGMGESWNTLVDYTDVSDIDYFRDIDSATLSVSSTNHLNQQARLGYTTDHWDLGIQAQAFETLILDGLEQYRQLPRVDANGRYRFNDSNMVLTLKQHHVTFDHSEDNIFGSGIPLTTDSANTTITGSRFRGNYGITWDKEWLWGFFRPSFAAKYVSYELNDPLLNQTDTSPSALVPVTSLDTGLFFERENNLFTGYIQTFEPRVYYLKSEYEDQSAIPNFDTSELTFSYHQLFRDDRFSGGDRIGDTEQITFGVTSRLINGSTGMEKIRFSLGQVYYMSDRKVALTTEEFEELTRDNSDIALELSARFSEDWRFQTDMLTTDDGGTINKGSFSLRYNNDEDRIFNIGYRYSRRDNVLSGNRFVRADIDQADISFALPVNETWRLLGRYYQDLRISQELEVFAGIEYASCCWRISVVGRRWIERDDVFVIDEDELDHNNGIFFQIQFRGLAGTGKRVSNILSEGIYGYTPPED